MGRVLFDVAEPALFIGIDVRIARLVVGYIGAMFTHTVILVGDVWLAAEKSLILFRDRRGLGHNQ